MSAYFFLIGLSSSYTNHTELVYLTLAVALLVALSHARIKTLSLVLWTLLGALSAQAELVSYQKNLLPKVLEQIPIEIEGRVLGYPSCQNHFCRFDFLIDEIWPKTHWTGRKIRLSWYHKSELLPDQSLRLQVLLKQPHGLKNPGTLDKEKAFFRQDITAEGSVKKLLAEPPVPKASFRSALNQTLNDKLERLTNAGVLKGLVLGITDGIERDTWDLFSATGTSHLLAISGLHIGLIGALVAFIIKFFWSLSTQLLIRCPLPVVGAWSGTLGAVFYAACAGFALPTQRACVMILCYNLQRILGIPISAWTRFHWAMWAVLLIDRRAPMSVGFWLSFGSVFLLLVTFQNRVKAASGFQAWFQAQKTMALGMLPLGLATFGTSALTAPLANALAIPWMSFIILPLAFLGLLCLQFSNGPNLFFILADWQLQKLYAFLSPLAQVKVWHAPCLTSLKLSVLSLVSLGFISRQTLINPYLLLASALLFMQPGNGTVTKGQARVDVLDVGQGLCVLVRTQNHALLYDTGPSFPGGGDLVSSQIYPALRHLGVESLDEIIVSHADSDHAGGLQSLMGLLPSRVYTPEPAALSVPAEACRRGHNWSWDGVEFRFLHPQTLLKTRNASSCVLQVTTLGGSLLLSGDIDKKAEQLLIAHKQQDLKADVLLAPHHGSHSSSSQAWIDAVEPRHVIFATGYLNRWRFPAHSVQMRYRARGAELYNTADKGHLQFVLPAYRGEIKIESLRDKEPPPWGKL